jgi:hypothetical protein
MRRASPADIYNTLVREYRDELKANPYARALNSRYYHHRKPQVLVKRPQRTEVVYKTTVWPVEKPSFMNLLKPKLGISSPPSRRTRSAGGSYIRREQRSRVRKRLESSDIEEPWRSSAFSNYMQ